MTLRKITVVINIFLLSSTASSIELPAAAATATDTAIQTWCAALSRDLKSVKLDKCLLRDWKIAGFSVQHRPIPYLHWGNPEGRKVLLIGSLHGDEITSVSLIFRWLENFEKIPTDTALGKQHYLLAPLMNPDGYTIRPRTRVNARGVDLNRNFQSKRGEKEAVSYWKTRSKKDPRRFPGLQLGSEPETLVMQKLIDEFKPDMIVSAHAPYGVVDHDGPVIFSKNIHSPLKVKALGAFPGSLGQYAGVEKKIPVITVELSDSKMMPSQKVIDELMDFVLNAK